MIAPAASRQTLPAVQGQEMVVPVTEYGYKIRIESLPLNDYSLHLFISSGKVYFVSRLTLYIVNEAVFACDYFCASDPYKDGFELLTRFEFS